MKRTRKFRATGIFFIIALIVSCGDSHFKSMGSSLEDKIFEVQSIEKNSTVQGIGFTPLSDQLRFSDHQFLFIVFPSCDIEEGESILVKSKKTQKEFKNKAYKVMEGESGLSLLCIQIWIRDFLETEGKSTKQVWKEEASLTAGLFKRNPNKNVIIKGMSQNEFMEFLSIGNNNLSQTIEELAEDFQRLEKEIFESISHE